MVSRANMLGAPANVFDATAAVDAAVSCTLSGRREWLDRWLSLSEAGVR
jgi:hypothetical protein